MNRRNFSAVTAVALALGIVPHTSSAQNYPTRTIMMVIPFAAGGGTDNTGRMIAEELGKALGQTVVVENRAGANGAIGSAVVAKAAPDGHTILMTASSTYSLNTHLMKDLPYDQKRDLAPVATIGANPWVLVVNPQSEFKTVADLVTFGKANPGKLTYGFWQSSTLVTGEMFAKHTGAVIRKVPYKGTAEAIADLFGQRVSMLFMDTTGQGHIQSGAMRALAVTIKERATAFPDVPTMAEAGYPAVETGSTNAIFVPAATPLAIRQRLNTEINKIIQKPEIAERLKRQGSNPSIRSLEESEQFVISEFSRWEGMISGAGLEKQ